MILSLVLKGEIKHMFQLKNDNKEINNIEKILKNLPGCKYEDCRIICKNQVCVDLLCGYYRNRVNNI